MKKCKHKTKHRKAIKVYRKGLYIGLISECKKCGKQFDHQP